MNVIIVEDEEKQQSILKRFLNEYLGEKKELSIMPYNTLLFEAAEETSIIDMFLRLSNIKDTSDTNYLFMVEINKLVDKIINKLKELQVRMR